MIDEKFIKIADNQNDMMFVCLNKAHDFLAVSFLPTLYII